MPEIFQSMGYEIEIMRKEGETFLKLFIGDVSGNGDYICITECELPTLIKNLTEIDQSIRNGEFSGIESGGE